MTATGGTTYLGTRDVPTVDLTPFPGNAKRGDVDTIRGSIRRNGQYRSLVVRSAPDGRLIVLAGNHTLQALILEGHPTARCEIVECDDDTARRINLADNRTAELGDYDRDGLAELLSYLDGDYEGTGYTDEYVQALITPPSEDWEDAFDNLPDGDRQHLTRTYTLTAEQAEIIDRAMSTAVEHVDDTDGNRNGAALTVICDAYNRDHT